MDEPDFYCLCGSQHVLTGAKWIGFLGTLCFSLLALFSALWAHSLAGLFVALAILPLCLGLVFACRRLEPRLYFPFLLANGLLSMLNGLYIFFVGLMLIWMPKFWRDHLDLSLGPHDGVSEMRQSTALLLAGVALFESLLCWVQSVVLSAYLYMSEDHLTLIPPLPPAFGKQKKKRGARESQLA